MKKILITLLLLAVLGAGVGFYMYNKPVDKMHTRSIDETVTAQQLFTSYEADEMAANKRFLDKILIVEGEVIKTKNDDNKMTIFLDTGDMLANIMCQMESLDTETPKEGSKIAIKGLCTGYLTDVVLIKGILIK